MTDAEPGVTTIKLPTPTTNDHQINNNHPRPQRSPAELLTTRELDVELCYVCKRCRVACPGEKQLLSHQRQCYGSRESERGSYRVVRKVYECKMCGGDRFKSLAELRKHFECEQHLKVIKGTSIGQSTSSSTTTTTTTTTTTSTATTASSSSAQHGGLLLPPPAESPLSHEMEDVVNQITLLAARAAAQETDGPTSSSTVRGAGLDTNANNNEPKRRFLSPADVVPPLTGAGR